MNPFRRRRRTRRDMIVLGGWLFADLLLGLAMIFLVANTAGSPPPTPTPTATPDQLATAEASFAAQNASQRATEEALESDLALLEQSSLQTAQAQDANSLAATQTAEAEATEAALSDSELATREAQSTQDALGAQATIAAFATEIASSDADQSAAAAELATISAQATTVSQQVDAQATEQAEVSAIATANADSGANTQATIAALESSQSTSADALATAEAQQANFQATIDASEAEQANAEATSAALLDQAQSNAISSSSVEEVIQVDLGGVISGDSGAIADAEELIAETFQPYVEADCRAGFVFISARAPTIGEGVALSDAVFELLGPTVPEVFSETGSEGVAFPETSPSGEVFLQLFLNSGCGLLDTSS